MPTNLLAFPEITMSSINCNSLNMSAMSSFHQRQKIHAISKLNTDIIFLSDIRLGNVSDGVKVTELERLLLLNPLAGYKILHNSKKSSRGVGILIKHDLPILVTATAEDNKENLLALHCSLKATEFIIVSIYGPNKLCKDFFVDIDNVLSKVSHLPIIIAGDWNCTPSTDPVSINPE